MTLGELELGDQLSGLSSKIPKPGLLYLGSQCEVIFGIYKFSQLFTWPTDQPRHATQRFNLSGRFQFTPLV